MAKCPICYTEYLESTLETPLEKCAVCEWDLKYYNLPQTGKYRQAFAKKEQAHLDWARKMWQKYLVQQNHSLTQPVNVNPLVNNSYRESVNQSLEYAIILKLEARLEQLESRLQTSELEIKSLRSELAVEQEENRHLKSQMEWVLYVLQEANPQDIQQTLWQLQEWAHALSNYPAQNQPQNQPQNYLKSEVGMDYSKLEKLLAAGKWRQADERTWDIMLRVANQEDRGFLNLEDIEGFPATDLETIAWLWDYYSGGRFGFHIQYKIWQTVGNDYTIFCDRVGWRVKENWLYYDDLNCSITAAEGHLPVTGWRKRSCYGLGGATAQENTAALIARFNVLNNVNI